MQIILLGVVHAALAASTAPVPERGTSPIFRPNAKPANAALLDEAARTPEHLVSDDRALSYTFVEALFVTQMLDDAPAGVDDPDGFAVGVSAAILDDFFVTAGGSRTQTDVFGGEVDYDDVGFTLGAHTPAGNGLDAFVEVGWSWVEADGPGAFDAEDDGLVAGAGLRYRANFTWEALGAVGYEDVGDEDGLSFTAGLVAHVSARASIVGTYTFGEDADAWGVGLRVDL